MKPIATFCLLSLTLTGFSAGLLQADEVTDWNAIMFQAALTANTTPHHPRSGDRARRGF
jgi:hypothetical protein